MDEVWLVVSPQNPFKAPAGLAPAEHRLRMAHIAIAGNHQLRVCDEEFRLPVPSYTIHTLDRLSELYPDIEFTLLLGQDLVASFHQWKDAAVIQKRHPICVYPRRTQEDSRAELPEGFTFCEAPMLNVSSTYIRECTALGHSVRYLVPDEVISYISEHGLYHAH
jgi:nicotinate-nucleotide adenylyltransferase